MQIIIYLITGAFIFLEGMRDFFHRKVSVVTVAVIAIMGVILHIFEGGLMWISALSGALIGVVFLLIAKITREGIGYGDGWMITATGIVLGFRRNFLLLCCALILCAIVSVFLLIFRKAGKKTELPFVSFLFPAFVIVCLTG